MRGRGFDAGGFSFSGLALHTLFCVMILDEESAAVQT